MTLQWKRHRNTEIIDDDISVELAVSICSEENGLEIFHRKRYREENLSNLIISYMTRRGIRMMTAAAIGLLFFLISKDMY